MKQLAFDIVDNLSNKQYFLSNGIFALEQVGELNQIQLGSEISLNIKDEFSSFENLSNTIALHYEKKNQIWYFFPYASDKYFHTIWINYYVNSTDIPIINQRIRKGICNLSLERSPI